MVVCRGPPQASYTDEVDNSPEGLLGQGIDNQDKHLHLVVYIPGLNDDESGLGVLCPEGRERTPRVLAIVVVVHVRGHQCRSAYVYLMHTVRELRID
jgi:hypothetical protein